MMAMIASDKNLAHTLDNLENKLTTRSFQDRAIDNNGIPARINIGGSRFKRADMR